MQILGTWQYMHDDRFNCVACKQQHRDPSVVKRSREFKGCYKEVKRTIYSYNKMFYFKRCPGNFYNGAIAEIIRMHASNRGLIEHDYMNQPNKLVEMFLILDNLQEEFNHKQSRNRNGK